MLGGLAAEPLQLGSSLLNELAAALETLLELLLSGFDLAKLLISGVGHWISRETNVGS